MVERSRKIVASGKYSRVRDSQHECHSMYNFYNLCSSSQRYWHDPRGPRSKRSAQACEALTLYIWHQTRLVSTFCKKQPFELLDKSFWVGYLRMETCIEVTQRADSWRLLMSHTLSTWTLSCGKGFAFAPMTLKARYFARWWSHSWDYHNFIGIQTRPGWTFFGILLILLPSW